MATAGGILDKDDLRDVSGKGRVDAQEAWFRAEGIPCRRNSKSELLVAWVHVHAWLEGKPPVSFVEPDLSGVS